MVKRKPKRSTKRKNIKRKSKSKRKTKRKSTKKRKPFGGYSIDFTNRHETMEDVFGKKNITPAEMTKILWKFIKKRRLASHG